MAHLHMTRNELVAINNLTYQLDKHDVKDTKFTYWIIKLRNLLKSEVDILQEQLNLINNNTKYQEYITKLKEAEHQKDSQYEEEKLKEEYKDVISNYNESVNNFNKSLEEKIEIDLPTYHIDYLPSNLDPQIIEILFHLIDE